MKSGKTQISVLIVLVAAVLGGLALFTPIEVYPTRSTSVAAGWRAEVWPARLLVNGTFLEAQVFVSALDQSSPNGYHFKAVTGLPLVSRESRQGFDGFVSIKGFVNQAAGSTYKLYVFNETGFVSWQDGQTPTPYYGALGVPNVSFQLSLKEDEALSPIYFVIEATGGFTDVTLQSRVEYTVNGGIPHKSLLSAGDSTIPGDARDMVLRGNVRREIWRCCEETPFGHQDLYNFYVLDNEEFIEVQAGRAEPASVPSLFSAANVSTGVDFAIPLKGQGLRSFNFLVEPASVIGLNPVRVILNADVFYKYRLQATGAQTVVARSTMFLLLVKSVVDVYPQLYGLGAIVIFGLVLASIRTLVFIGFGSASESRFWRGLDTLREKLSALRKRRISRQFRPSKAY